MSADIPAGAPTDGEHAVEQAIAAAAPDFGDLFARAVFASFFHSPIIGIHAPPGGQATPVFGRSPVDQVAQAVWERCGAQVVRDVARVFDIDDLVERVTGRLYQRLTDTTEDGDRYGHGRWDKLTPALPDVQRMVRERLAERLTERQMAAWDAEQEQMRAAWERERQRVAEQPAAIETTSKDASP